MCRIELRQCGVWVLCCVGQLKERKAISALALAPGPEVSTTERKYFLGKAQECALCVRVSV